MVSSLFVTEGIQYHGGLRSRELGQAPGQWSLVCKTLVIAYGCSWSNKDRPLVNPASRAPRNEDTRLMPTAGSLNAAYFQQSCCEHHQNTPTNYLKNLWVKGGYPIIFVLNIFPKQMLILYTFLNQMRFVKNIRPKMIG